MTWIQVATTIVLVGAALAVLAKAIRWVYGFTEKILQFLDDWAGEPERPGIAPARPGVLQRISNLEASAKIVERQVQPNDGLSMKDQIARIEERIVPAADRPAPQS